MKKNKIILIIIAVVVIIASGFIFVNSKKDYSSLPKIVVNMDISTKNKKKNTEILRKLAEKNDYFYTNQSYDEKTVVSIGIKKTYDFLDYDIDAPSMLYVKKDRKDLTDSEQNKINKIKKNDSLKNVLASLGEPNVIERKGEGSFKMYWGEDVKSAKITFENKKVVDVKSYD